MSFLLQVYFSDEIRQLPEGLADTVHLLPDVLRKSRAEGTDRKYYGAFTRCHKWVLSNGLRSSDILPTNALTVAICLVSLIQSAKSPSSVFFYAFCGIKRFHGIYGLYLPTNSKLVVNVLESAKRILSKHTVKKDPITIDILISLYLRLYSENKFEKSDNNYLFSWVFCFLRSSEILNIRTSDIVFNSSYMAIFIECSKTGKYRNNAWVMITKTGTMSSAENVRKLI